MKIVQRASLQATIDQYIGEYREALQVSTELQSAFIRKFDDLGGVDGLPHVAKMGFRG